MISHAVLAEIAGQVYCGPWSARVAGDVKYDLLPRGRNEIVVALPGTDPADALDWLRDFSFWPVWARGIGYVHSGFGEGARAAWENMAPNLPGDRLITFCGHSLGGALAACLAATHAHERPGVAFRLVTFGQPRVAFLNPWFGRLISRGWQKAIYVRAGDPVPDVPLWPYLLGGAPTRIGVEVVNPIANHDIAKYAADLAALGV